MTNLINLITIIRIILAPVILFFLIIGNYLMCTMLFFIAGLTDYLDGLVARKSNQITSLGALLDLLADKLLVCLVLIWCAFLSYSIWIIIPVLMILSRELIISSIRQFLVEKTGENPIKVTYIAKSKTTIQMIAISFLILNPEMGLFFQKITVILIWTAASISIYSLYNYFNSYRNYF